jgi:hypothetical protein
MERPLITLSTKDFFTGIAPGSHTERGGLFASATGITPAYDLGGSASTQNGLLQAGPAPTNLGGSTVVDTIFAACSGVLVSTMQAFFWSDEGRLYRHLANGTLNDLMDGSPAAVSNSRAGLKLWNSTSATDRGLLYWQSTQIGLWDGATDSTTFTNNKYAVTGTMNWPCPHIFLGNVYFSISSTGKIGALLDNGAGTVTVNSAVLDFDLKYSCYSIADDGVYLVMALSQNQEGTDIFANNKIIFWDTVSSSWQREYIIKDPFIWKVERVGNAVYAFGQKGIYEVSFGGGVRKLPPRFTAFGTPTDVVIGYGTQRATSYNHDTLIWATDTTIDTYGPPEPGAAPAYFKPFKVPSAVGTPTLVFSDFATGAVYVATDGDKLYKYEFNSSTRETSVSAQTIYFPLLYKTQITKLEVVFGEPLTTGDALTIQLKTDEDSSAIPGTALTISRALHGAIRRKTVTFQNTFAEAPFCVVVTLTAGAPKIKTINVYGHAVPNE